MAFQTAGIGNVYRCWLIGTKKSVCHFRSNSCTVLVTVEGHGLGVTFSISTAP